MLAWDHIFPDGNKRTALVVSLAIMNTKGGVVELPTQEAHPKTKRIDGSMMLLREGGDEMAVALRSMASFGSYELRSDASDE